MVDRQTDRHLSICTWLLSKTNHFKSTVLSCTGPRGLQQSSHGGRLRFPNLKTVLDLCLGTCSSARMQLSWMYLLFLSHWPRTWQKQLGWRRVYFGPSESSSPSQWEGKSEQLIHSCVGSTADALFVKDPISIFSCVDCTIADTVSIGNVWTCKNGCLPINLYLQTERMNQIWTMGWNLFTPHLEKIGSFL